MDENSEGTYGVLVKGEGDVNVKQDGCGKSKTDQSKEKFVAIKKIRLKSCHEGLSMDAIREIKLLQELDHPNIMTVLDIYNNNSNVHIVMDLCPVDLEKVITCDKAMNTGDIKQFMRMVLLGVGNCHENWIVHRDLKPANFLLDDDGQLRLADFGLAKIYGSPDRSLSNQACTLWYRAPELLYGATEYGSGADMWSIGCIFAELLTRKPFLPGETDSELHQLQVIFQKLGTPTKEDWPGMEQLPQYTKFRDCPGVPLSTMLPAAQDDALDLLKRLLMYDPSARPTCQEALEHAYFSSYPPPTPPAKLPRPSVPESKREM